MSFHWRTSVFIIGDQSTSKGSGHDRSERCQQPLKHPSLQTFHYWFSLVRQKSSPEKSVATLPATLFSWDGACTWRFIHSMCDTCKTSEHSDHGKSISSAESNPVLDTCCNQCSGPDARTAATIGAVVIPLSCGTIMLSNMGCALRQVLFLKTRTSQ